MISAPGRTVERTTRALWDSADPDSPPALLDAAEKTHV